MMVYFEPILIDGQFLFSLLIFYLFYCGFEDVVGAIQRPQNFCSKNGSVDCLIFVFGCLCHLKFQFNYSNQINKSNIINVERVKKTFHLNFSLYMMVKFILWQSVMLDRCLWLLWQQSQHLIWVQVLNFFGGSMLNSKSTIHDEEY